MQIFIFDNPLSTALMLDSRRFYAQIREAKIIFKWCTMIRNGEGDRWRNQPLVRMYIDHMDWLNLYIELFETVKRKDIERSNEINRKMLSITPNWHCEEYYNQMKRRLYTKNKNYYKMWSELGESYNNWYWVDNKWKIYNQK